MPFPPDPRRLARSRAWIRLRTASARRGRVPGTRGGGKPAEPGRGAPSTRAGGRVPYVVRNAARRTAISVAVAGLLLSRRDGAN